MHTVDSPAPDLLPPFSGAGAPAWAGAPLRSTLAFLSVPAALGVAILALHLELPPAALYGIGALLGAVLVVRMAADPEWLLAAFILYVPLCKLFVAGVAPGLNGTNALLALMLIAWAIRAEREGRPLFVSMPCSRLVGAWGAVTLLSVATAAVRFGPDFILDDHAGDVKQWVDNFLVFFAALHLIRDGAMARRAVVYMMIGAVAVLGLGVQEWLDKRWLDSIDKARLLGPQLQPNDFGAFLVYVAGPFLGLFLTQLRRPRAALLVPYFAVLAKILLATFSRGAFIGMAAAGLAAAWVRGRAFVIGVGLLGAALVVAVPQLVPRSLAARIGSTAAAAPGYADEALDTSSETRLVLWRAAVEMSLESPLLGKGFKAFPRLKGEYADTLVRESDNHNMFLYVSSQMGIPALLMLLWLLWRTWRLGVSVHRAAPDDFARAIGMGGAAMAVGVLGVNMFGSRMVDIAVSGYFWIYLAVLAHLWVEVAGAAPPAAGGEARP